MGGLECSWEQTGATREDSSAIFGVGALGGGYDVWYAASLEWLLCIPTPRMLATWRSREGYPFRRVRDAQSVSQAGGLRRSTSVSVSRSSRLTE